MGQGECCGDWLASAAAWRASRRTRATSAADPSGASRLHSGTLPAAGRLSQLGSGMSRSGAGGVLFTPESSRHDLRRGSKILKQVLSERRLPTVNLRRSVIPGRRLGPAQWEERQSVTTGRSCQKAVAVMSRPAPGAAMLLLPWPGVAGRRRGCHDGPVRQAGVPRRLGGLGGTSARERANKIRDRRCRTGCTAAIWYAAHSRSAQPTRLEFVTCRCGWGLYSPPQEWRHDLGTYARNLGESLQRLKVLKRVLTPVRVAPDRRLTLDYSEVTPSRLGIVAVMNA